MGNFLSSPRAFPDPSFLLNELRAGPAGGGLRELGPARFGRGAHVSESLGFCPRKLLGVDFHDRHS